MTVFSNWQLKTVTCPSCTQGPNSWCQLKYSSRNPIFRQAVHQFHCGPLLQRIHKSLGVMVKVSSAATALRIALQRDVPASERTFFVTRNVIALDPAAISKFRFDVILYLSFVHVIIQLLPA